MAGGEAMSRPLIIFVGLIYLVIAVDQLRKNNPGMAIVYAGYAFANVGMCIIAT